MKRRAFIALLGGAVVCVPFARAQQTGKAPTIGLLTGSTAAADEAIHSFFTRRDGLLR
jgi:hypothetical protein